MPLQDAATIAVGDSSSANGGPQPAADRRLLIDGRLVTTEPGLPVGQPRHR